MFSAMNLLDVSAMKFEGSLSVVLSFCFCCLNGRQMNNKIFLRGFYDYGESKWDV